MRNVSLTPRAFDDLNYWAREDGQMVLKIFTLIQDIQRDPFRGLGRPEPLRAQIPRALVETN